VSEDLALALTCVEDPPRLETPIRNAGAYIGFSVEPTSWSEGLFEPALKVMDGEVPIPDGPGWGGTISKDWLEHAERQISERI